MLAGSAAAVDEPPVKLSISPVGGQGSFISVELEPGEQRSLDLLLGNHASAAILARTYAADAYSLVNGGFGARLHGDPTTGPTLWLTYPTEELEIQAGSGVERAVRVAVPPGTPPGEYVSALVIENAQALPGSGGMAFDQVLRQAIAVVVTVPGPTQAMLQLGPAEHRWVTATSVVRLGIANEGNVLTKPAGEVVIANEAGSVVETLGVVLDSVYGGTSSLIEVALTEPLSPGRYMADVVLADPNRNVQAAASDLPFVVDGPPPAPGPADAGALALTDGFPAWLGIAIGIVGIMACAIVLLGIVAAMRRRRARSMPPG